MIQNGFKNSNVKKKNKQDLQMKFWEHVYETLLIHISNRNSGILFLFKSSVNYSIRLKSVLKSCKKKRQLTSTEESCIELLALILS